MKKVRHTVSQLEIGIFNKARENMVGKTFNVREFKDLLSKLNCPPNSNFIKCVVSGENPPFIRVERGKYAFNPNPVHIQRLQTVWDMYRTTTRKSSNLSKKQAEMFDVDKAIEALKKLGYRVLRQVTQYEECLLSTPHHYAKRKVLSGKSRLTQVNCCESDCGKC